MNTMTATWNGDMAFTQTSGTGHTLVTDVPVEKGGSDLGPTPMELLILGLMGCLGLDVVSILKGMRQPLEGLTITASFERAEDHPKIYTAIHLALAFRGDLEAKKVDRAIKLSESKYCSVSAMLGHDARITRDFTIEGR
jgi:putative redox protein